MEPSWSYSIRFDGKDQVLVVDCTSINETPSLVESEKCMAEILAMLVKEPDTDRIILSELVETEYDKPQVFWLKEIAQVIEDTRYWPKRKTKPEEMRVKGEACKKCYAERLQTITNVLDDQLYKDPVAAYIMIRILLEEEYKALEREETDQCLDCRSYYIKNCLQPLNKIFNASKFFQEISMRLHLLKPEERKIYQEFFPSLSRPYFSTSRILQTRPTNLDLLQRYQVGDAKVEIYQHKTKPEFLYFILPAEYELTNKQFYIINEARKRLLRIDPTKIDFTDTERVIKYFTRICRRMVTEASTDLGMSIDIEEVNYLSKILAKYTAGMGITEVLLQDEKVTDVYINSPISENPLYIVHRDYGECATNIYLTQGDVESLISRFRARSGRPFSEAVPIMDLEIP
ncbi:MAG: hypothetical protein DRO11_04205, partial [Methanobacteriota archaeon]